MSFLGLDRPHGIPLEKRENKMDNKQLLGILGSVMLGIGVFMPLISLPVVGSINYFHNGKGDGVFVLVFAFISLLLVLSHRYRGLWVTSLLSAALLLFSVTRFQWGMSELKADMSTELAGNPFRGIADVAVASIQLQWGLGVMVIGLTLLIVVAALAPPLPEVTAPAD